MKRHRRCRAVVKIVCEPIEIRVLFGLDESRLSPVLVDRQLANHRAQPAAQRTCPGIVSEFACGPAIIAGFQSMQLRPDRLRDIVSHCFVRTGRPRRGTHGRAIAFKQIAPSNLVATFARNDQAKIVGMQAIQEFIDRRFLGRIILEQIFLDRRQKPGA